jgi:hypothetical protein
MSLFRATSAQADDRNPDDRNPDDRSPDDRNPDGRNPDDRNFGEHTANDRNSNGRTTGGLDPNGRNTGREPYRINRVPGDLPAIDPIPDGPTQRIDKKTIRRGRRNRSNLLVLVVAMLALNVAGVAGLLAWRAFGLARAMATVGGHAAPAAPATRAAITAPPTVVGYAVAYAQEPLRVQVGCSAVMFLDLDEPRANAGENVSDLRYDSRCGTHPPDLTLGPGATAGAQVTGADIDAAGCSEAIRTSPLGPGASVEVKKGAELCVLTAATPPEMVLVEVTDVGQTGMAGMRATSWKVTG